MVEKTTVENYLAILSPSKFKELMGLDNRFKVSLSTYGAMFSCKIALNGNLGRSVSLSISMGNDRWESTDDLSKLTLLCRDDWRDYITGLGEAISVDVTSFRTSEEAVKAVIAEFSNRWRKPPSAGCVKAYLTSSKFMWVWKRAGSDSIVQIGDNPDDTFLKKTYDCMINVSTDNSSSELVAVTWDSLNAIQGGRHDTIILHGRGYYYKSALIPLYANSIPFNTVSSYCARGEEDGYEFMMVDGEVRYLNMPRSRNGFLSRHIHGYSERVETYIPLEKLFLKGKSDFYAKRPQEETPFLGFELEACTNKSDLTNEQVAKKMKEYLPWLVMCKSDGSISPQGFETVSIPATLDFWKESNLSSALDSMRVAPYNMRSFEHSSCGFHVHVSRSSLSVLDLQKLERFIHNPDNRDFVVAIAGRGSNNYQKYNSDLFNNRKRWLRTPRSDRNVNVEGLTYLSGGFEVGAEALRRDFITNRESLSLDARLQLFSLWTNNYLSQSSFANTLSLSDEFNTLYRQDSQIANAWRMGNFADFLFMAIQNPSAYSEYLGRYVIGETFEERKERFYKLFQDLIMMVCRVSPKFASLIKPHFPEFPWEGVVIAEAASSTTTHQIGGLLKSRAKSSRRYNKQTSELVKGPVGKAVNDRYDVLNTKNNNTIEFRLFKGTMNPSSVMRYLEFVDALVRFVACTSANDEGVNYKTFIKWLRSDGFNVSRYENLLSFIIDKQFVERREVRRRELPKVLSEDKNTEGLLAVEAKGFEETKSKAIGTWNNPPTTECEQAPPVFIAPEYSDEEEDEPCDCESCRPDLYDDEGNFIGY